MICVLIFLMVIVLAGGLLAFLAVQKIVAHARRQPEAVTAITQHVLLPLFEKRPEEPPPGEAASEPLPE
jgi:hypothetical protein